MLSVKECKKYIGKNISDKKVEIIRNTLYSLTENALDKSLFRGIVPLESNEQEDGEKK